MKRGVIVDKMMLVHEGIVQLDIKLGFSPEEDKKNTFIIERLSQGALVNVKSFLPDIDDEADTDYKCATQVSVYTLESNKMRELSKNE